MGFFTGTKGKYRQLDLLEKAQQPLKQQLFAASQNQRAGGAFGDAADYYRSLLNEENPTYSALAAPQMRQFREEIVPGLAEQFAGFGGAGGEGLSGSGFRNAAVNAGTDLAERLGAIRAQLRQQGAAGLAGIGQSALQPFVENVYEKPQPGFLESIAPAIGGVASMFGGPIAGAIGNVAGNWLTNKFGNSSPYGDRQQGRSEIANYKPPSRQNINFMNRGY